MRSSFIHAHALKCRLAGNQTLPKSSFTAAVPLSFKPSRITVDSWEQGLARIFPKEPTSEALI